MRFRQRTMRLLILFLLSASVVISGMITFAVADISNDDSDMEIGKVTLQVTSNLANSKVKLKKGKIFTKGKFIYKIVSLKGNRGNVSLIGAKSKFIKSARIPKIVKKKGYKFKVISIGKKAFMNFKMLKSVTTDAKITSIGRKAFYGCRKLNKINIPNENLKKVGKNAFKGIYKNAVKVPKIKCKSNKALTNIIEQTTEVYTEPVHTHKYTNWKMIISPTCTTNGKQIGTCSCSDVKIRVIPELGHNYSKIFVVDSVATCNTEGTMSRHCTWCNSKIDVTIISKFGHFFTNYVYNNDASCMEDGTETAKCEYCDETFTRIKENSALGHNYPDEFTVDVEPTCETDGLKSKYCSRCNARTEITKIDKQGHNFSNYTYNNDATCVADGTETAICSRCTKEDTRIKVGTVLGYSGHKFGDWETEIGATCTSWGTIVRFCSVCGEKEKEIVQPLGHSFEKYISNNDATCTEDGTETAKCERCAVTDSHTVIGSALGHDYSNEFTVDTKATCEKDGLKSKHCSRCEAKTQETTIKKLGHDFAVYTYNNDATCTSDGTETAICSRCKKTDVRTEIGSALGHDYADKFTIDEKATCEKDGSQSRHCIRCDAKKDIETIEKLGHDFAVYTYNNNATCTSDGTETAICSRCKKTDVRTEIGSALGHDYADKFTIDEKATCEKDGSKSKHCSRCDAKTQVTAIEKLGHNYSDYTYNDDATCINDGTETAVCNRCMKEDTRTKAGTALGYSGHKFGDWKTDIQVTCTKWGTIARTCSICGEKETEIVQAPGHRYEKYISNNDATCTEDGTETAICENCGETDSHTVFGSALGHKYSDQFTVDIEATCEKAGSKSKHCIRCDDKIEVTKIKKLGHSYTNYVYNEDATCTEDGTETAKCDRCESTKNRIKEGSAKGHIWDKSTNKCTVCGASAPEEIISRLIYNSGFVGFQVNMARQIEYIKTRCTPDFLMYTFIIN